MPETQQDRDNAVAEPSPAYLVMSPKWAMMDTLLGGTAAMRVAGQTYMPQHSAESPENYATRLTQTVLYNMTELTLNSLVGRVFREPVELQKDVPAQIKAFEKDIDCQGTDMTTFCQNWFREALAKGFCHLMIDMPSITPEERASRTLRDDIQQNHRPFWSIVKPENCIFQYWEMNAGVETLLQARIVEFKKSLNGFREMCETNIRVLTPGGWALWKDENEGKKGKKAKWIQISEGFSDLSVIPLITYYATPKDGCMVCKLPLEDLAFLNIRHWQSTSDQINVLTVARFPMLAASGAQQEAGKSTMPIGPRQLLSMKDPNGRFYYVEHTGRAIDAGKDDIEGLEDRMSAYGAEFLRRQISGRTAFERAMDTNESMSVLKSMATLFESAVHKALHLTAQWLSLGEDQEVGGTVKINKEYTEEDNKDNPMKVLADARTRGDVSCRTFIIEAIRHKVLNDTTDVDAEIAQLQKEAEEGPHPPQWYQAQLQVQGQLDAAGAIAQSDGSSAIPKPIKKKAATK